MTAVLERLLTEANALSPTERQELVHALSTRLSETPQPSESTWEDRVAQVRACRGKYRDILSSTDQFLARKQEEIELENRRLSR